MTITQKTERSLRIRLNKTDGGIKAAAALGGISERAAHKILRHESIIQSTYDAFCLGLSRLEELEADQVQKNEQKSMESYKPARA